MINVDFKDLKKTNLDVVGWVKVNGTNINYPWRTDKTMFGTLRKVLNNGWIIQIILLLKYLLN